MPTPPRTWAAGDPVSPTYLDGDLYTYNGQYLTPTGIRFAARKPIYKSTPSAVVSVAGTSWQFCYQGVTADVIVDSSGNYGISMDPALWGAIQSNVAAADGTAGDTGGGWHLLWGFTPIASGGDNAGYGAALALGATNNTNAGTLQKGNTAHATSSFVFDLIDLPSSSSYSLTAYNGHGTALNTVNVSSGNGKTVLFHALWACSDSGTTASSAPAPKQSWSNSDTWTASFANGNTGIRDILRVFNYPPVFRGHDTTQQSVTTATATVMKLGTNDSTRLDTYSGWNNSTSTYTIPRDGLYLVYGLVPWSTSSAGQRTTAIRVNGTDYWGPACPAPSAGECTATKIQIFSLNSGDTLQLTGWQNTGGNLTPPADRDPKMVVVWLSGIGTPSPLPSVPDLSYRYTAGTPSPLTSVFNSHLASDLSFLTYRPYLLAYQANAQTGIAQGSDVQVNMDTVAGIIHTDTGDNYSGWSAGNHWYQAVCTGWYLVVYEVSMQLPTLTTSPVNIADIFVTNNGTSTADQYQELTSTSATNPSGATAIGLYYLRAGDQIYPGLYSADMTATTVSTNVGAGATTGVRNSHFECVWVST